MRLDINLATHPYEDVRRFWLRWGSALAGLSLVTLALIISALMGWRGAARDRTLIREREHQIAARDQERVKAEALLNRPENRTVRDRSQFLNDLFEQKSFSWTQVFEDLEHVMPAHLHVVSIQPQTTQQHQLELKLMVAGDSRERALELVRNMENSQHFRQTQIEEEQVSRSATPGDNVQFTISSLYIPEREMASKRSGP
jgi:type IV pilus assembly protein PilN